MTNIQVPNPPPPMTPSETRTAVDIIFDSYPWLRQLGDMYGLITNLVIQSYPASLIAAEVRKTNQWKSRFGALEVRANKGLPPMNEADYLQAEASMAKLLNDYQVYELLFAGSTQRFRSWVNGQIVQDVSPAELSIRLDRGWASVENNREVAETFRQFYGVQPTDNAMLLYFLDPSLGTKEIERQVAASIVGGEALTYGLNISRTRAELFASRGVTESIARQGYANIAREEPILSKLADIHRYTPLTQGDLEDLFFHEDPDIIQQRAQIFNTALAEFSGPTSSGQGASELLDIRRTV